MLELLSSVMLLVTLSGGAVSAQEPAKLDAIRLDSARMDKGLTVMRALSARRSLRDFSSEPLTLQQLSELLWAANGVNRPDGGRTAPAAVNTQLVDIYVTMHEGRLQVRCARPPAASGRGRRPSQGGGPAGVRHERAGQSHLRPGPCQVQRPAARPRRRPG